MKGTQVQAWLRSWFDQCLLRRAPQDDALSTTALGGALLAYIGMDLLQALVSVSRDQALGMTLVDTLTMVVFTWGVLVLTGKSLRFAQTLTALAGTRALLGLLSVPLVAQVGNGGGETAGPTAMQVSAWLVLLIWNITVQANIFRHALSSRYGIGVLVACLHTVLAISLLQYLFPPSAV